MREYFKLFVKLSKFITTFALAALTACTGGLDTDLRSRASSAGGSALGDGFGQIDEFDDDLSLPTQVSGAFLVCANISTNDSADTTKITNIACSVTSDEKDGPLALETKALEESKEFVHNNFELSFTSDPLGGTYEVTKEDTGSNFDFKIKIETNNTLAQAAYLNRSTVTLNYKPSTSGMGLTGDSTLMGQIKMPLPDLLEGVGNSIKPTLDDLARPTATKNYSIPGKVIVNDDPFSLMVDGLFGLTYTSDEVETDFGIYSVTVVEEEYFLFGDVLDQRWTGTAMEPLDGASLPAFFNVDSNFNGPGRVISPFEGWTGTITGNSALYSSKLAEDGKIYAVGKYGNLGREYVENESTMTVEQDIADGLIVIIDPDNPSDYVPVYVGQPDTDEQLFGVDAKGKLIGAVGMTQGRDDTSGNIAGYITIIDYEKEEFDFFQHISTADGDIVFNDVSIVKEDLYAAAGLIVGEGCSKSKGLIMGISSKADATGEKQLDSINFNAFGIPDHNVYFSEILVREDGSYSVRATVEFSEDDDLNKGLGLTGEHEVTMYFDKDLTIQSSFLNDGRKVVLNKIDNFACSE